MVDDDQRRTVHEVVERRLDGIRTATGIPVFFFGNKPPTAASPHAALVLCSHVGLITTALSGLVVVRGRGLGGLVTDRGEPAMVRDYSTSRVISHEYDAQVVAAEMLTSMVAMPLTLGGEIRGVLYAANRSEAPIGERGLRLAVAATRQLEQELHHLLALDLSEGELLDVRDAITELGSIVDATRDPHLKARLERVRRRLATASDPDTTSGLTPREIEVLRLIAAGCTTAETGQRLHLSPASAKTYIRNAMRKLGVHSRAAAVTRAHNAGLL